MKRIHIIGGGQVGSVMAHYFLQKNHHVTVYDSGTTYAQVPWGWMRRVTLQQNERYRYPKKPLQLPEKYIVRGPMIISTASTFRKVKWEQWLKQTKTDAYLLNNDQASNLNIHEKYNLLCDSNDHLFDFQNYKMDLTKELKLCTKWIVESPVERLFWKNDALDGIRLSDGTFFPIAREDKVLICTGNRTSRFFSLPVSGITLKYCSFQSPVRPSPFIAHWTEEESVQYFPTFTKIGCGMKGMLSTTPPVSFWSNFFPLLRNKNYLSFDPTHKVRKKWNLKANDFQSCEIDITPDFLPIVNPMGLNVTVACGFSGSGFTVYEPWFQNHVERVMNHETDNNPFRLKRKFTARSFLY